MCMIAGRIRSLLGACSLALCAQVAPAGSADAQGTDKPKDAYPIRPIRLIVPFTTGGTADIVARAVAQSYAVQLGQPLVVDNRAGSGGVIGTETAAAAAKDGYTLMVGNISTMAVSPALYPRLRYDPVRDFTAVSLIASAPFVMVVPASLAARSVNEFVVLARSPTRRLNYASTGIGSPGHLAAALLSSSTGISMQHVPYKGIGPALVDLFSGEVHMLFLGIGPTQSQIKAGKLRALGVSGASRSPLMPELPSISESGIPGFDVTGWYGLFVPSGTPAAIVGQINAAQARTGASLEMKKQFAALGVELLATSRQQFTSFMSAEAAKWARVVKDAGIRPE